MKRIDREAVMDALRTRAPRAMHLAEITGRIGLHKARKDAVAGVLDDLIDLGMVKEMPGRRFRLTDGGRKNRASEPPKPFVLPRTVGRAGEGRIGGHLTVNPRGFAFLAAEDGGPDVFVPAHAVGPALHGDRVEVFARRSSRGREGEVVAVLSRRSPRITGVLEKLGRATVFEPDDPRLRAPMGIEGDLPDDAHPGKTLVADIVGYPQHSDDQCIVRVTEVLGTEGLTRVEVQKIKIREGIIEEFPEAVLEEARDFPKSVPASEKKGREDLRELDLVTIDPADARDHDDALYAERLGKEGYKVTIAIADVAHYVRERSAIDVEARRRGCSIYLPDRAIPMLPAELSSNLASLVPKRDRLCMAVEVELSSRGQVKGHRFIEGLMRSDAKLTYEGVARALGLTDEGPRQKEAESRVETLQILLELSRLLRRRRMQRGALDFDLPEPRVKLDENEVEPIDIVRSRADEGVREAYRLVEEMMLLANEVVAAELTTRGVPAIYRVHGKPDDTKIELFCRLAASLGYDLDPEDAQDPRQLSRFLRRIEDEPQADTLRYLLLRAMQQAIYDITAQVGHFGLAAKDYLHFTSPIRRYPDLAVHRALKQISRGEHVDAAVLKPKLRAIAAEASLLERRAMVVERNVVDLYRAILVQDRIGEEFDGTISGVEGHGLYVSFDHPYVDGFVPIERLDDDYYELDELGIRLTGTRTKRTFTLGDRIRVQLLDVNVSRREIIAVPTDFLGSDGESGGRTKRRRSGGSGAEKAGPGEKTKGSRDRKKGGRERERPARGRRGSGGRDGQRGDGGRSRSAKEGKPTSRQGGGKRNKKSKSGGRG